MALSGDQIDRYARHLVLKEIGGAGQARLLKARVLVVGAGGLGAPVLAYLAAAGVGHIDLVDPDVVSLSNLQRQILFKTSDVGRPKVECAAASLAALNPDVTITPHYQHLDTGNADEFVSGMSFIVDGCDNFETRLAAHAAAYRQKIPYSFAAVGQFDGHLSTFRGFEADQPCLQCFMPAPPPAGSLTTCEEAGVVGALTGIIGAMQAMEVIRELAGIGGGLAGRILLYDGLSASLRSIELPKDPACPLCGQAT
ncbi:MAG: HesA/MoeB/ThiF family protein [Pseudomonadota bacterium]